MRHIDNLSYLGLLTGNLRQEKGAGKTPLPKTKQKNLPTTQLFVILSFRIILKASVTEKALLILG